MYDPDWADQVKSIPAEDLDLSELESVTEDPKPVTVTDSKPVNVRRLVASILRAHAIITRVERKTTRIRIRIGRMLGRLRPLFPYGEWQRFVHASFNADTIPEADRISYETAQRYIRLARAAASHPELRDMPTMTAYREAEIICDKDTEIDKLGYYLTALTQDIIKTTTRFRSMLAGRMSEYAKLDSEDYGDRLEVLHLYRRELQLNEAVLALRESLNPREETPLHGQCEALKEWVEADTFIHTTTPSECIPEVIMDDEGRRKHGVLHPTPVAETPEERAERIANNRMLRGRELAQMADNIERGLPKYDGFNPMDNLPRN